jgi:hypothetical protein
MGYHNMPMLGLKITLKMLRFRICVQIFNNGAIIAWNLCGSILVAFHCLKLD